MIFSQAMIAFDMIVLIIIIETTLEFITVNFY
jgi:hypothetical protein